MLSWVSLTACTTPAQDHALLLLLNQIALDPRGQILINALCALAKQKGEKAEILIVHSKEEALPRPDLAQRQPGNVWRIHLPTLQRQAQQISQVVDELAAVYNNMTGILEGKDPFGGEGCKPEFDKTLEARWKNWRDEHCHLNNITTLLQNFIARLQKKRDDGEACESATEIVLKRLDNLKACDDLNDINHIIDLINLFDLIQNLKAQGQKDQQQTKTHPVEFETFLKKLNNSINLKAPSQNLNELLYKKLHPDEKYRFHFRPLLKALKHLNDFDNLIQDLRAQWQEGQCYGGIRRDDFKSLFKGAGQDDNIPGMTVCLSSPVWRTIPVPPLWENIESLKLECMWIDENTHLPQKVKRLEFNHCEISSFPPIPTGVVELRAPGCQIEQPPDLPTGLVILDLTDNLLTTLTHVPETVQSLHLAYNELQVLRLEKNEALKTLDISNNEQIQRLHLPPHLEKIADYNHGLTSLPRQPDTFRSKQV